MAVFELDEDTTTRLEAAASHQGLSSIDALKRAVLSFVEEVELRMDVELGLEDIANGRVIPDEEVRAYFEAKRKALMDRISN